MDSGNSGSFQSSSGADEECDSRAAVHDSGLITSHHLPHQPPPPPLFNHLIHHQNQITNNSNPLFFSSSSSPSPSSQQHQLLNLDSVMWNKTLPSFSDHHFSHATTTTNVSSEIPLVAGLLLGSGEGVMMTNLNPVPEDRETASATTATIATTTSTNPLPPSRNPKKRSRASRRAPTTVLNTDTHNFRAMVQQFTGIPSPPFTSPSSGFPTLNTSLDLFGRPSAMMRSNTNNFDHNLNALPSYLLPPKQYSSLIDHSCNNLLNTMQNPITFPYNPLNQSPLLNLKPTENPNPSIGFGVIGQTQIHEHHTTLPDLLSTAATPTTTSSRNDDPVASGNWDGGGGDNYNNGKEPSGVKGDQGFIEPWVCSSD
ncbi:putative VQ motif-containing protein [Helianthus annuus]|nr:putative VQ motif-containing protein [Helianthus annuus]